MNVEKNLMVLASAVESVEKLAQRMQESIEEYNEAILLSNKESIKRAHERMLCNCHMLILNYESKGTLEGALKLLKHMEEFDSRNKLFKVEHIN